jgi:hypothetical protein
MSDTDSPEAQARREAFYNRTCACGHAFGNHSMFSGCLQCPCGMADDSRQALEHAGWIKCRPLRTTPSQP